MIPSYLIPEVSLNGGAHRRSMASIEHVDSPKRQVTDVTSASIEEEEAQPTEVWAEKTEEAIQHENSEKTEKSQEPWSYLLRIHLTCESESLQTCHGVGRGGRLEFFLSADSVVSRNQGLEDEDAKQSIHLWLLFLSFDACYQDH